MYDYGFNAEGFATGGMNYLEKMIANLKARGTKINNFCVYYIHYLLSSSSSSPTPSLFPFPFSPPKTGILVIIDLHAPPGGGSSCSSYSGVIESDENLGFWRGSPWTSPHTPASLYFLLDNIFLKNIYIDHFLSFKI